jgi:hypothetical protein
MKASRRPPPRFALAIAAAAFVVGPSHANDPPPPLELLEIRSIHVEPLGGGETAGQLRDMIIVSLQRSGLFRLTEDAARADAVLRGSGEDLIFTDTFESSDSIDGRATVSLGSSSGRATSRGSYSNIGVGERESTRFSERKHEAWASVRLVSRDGDIVWSTTQESLGAKFLSASADVAGKILKQLADDLNRARSAALQTSNANALPR